MQKTLKDRLLALLMAFAICVTFMPAFMWASVGEVYADAPYVTQELTGVSVDNGDNKDGNIKLTFCAFVNDVRPNS